MVGRPRLPSAPVSPAPGKLWGCWSKPGGPHGSGYAEDTSRWIDQTSQTRTQNKERSLLPPSGHLRPYFWGNAKIPGAHTHTHTQSEWKRTCLSSSAAPSSRPHPLFLPAGDQWAKRDTWRPQTSLESSFSVESDSSVSFSQMKGEKQKSSVFKHKEAFDN